MTVDDVRVQRLVARVQGLLDEDPPPPDDDPLAALERAVDRLAERAHAHRQERLLFSIGPVVVFRWRAREGWPVEYVSPNVAALTGYPVEDFASERRSYASVIHPDDLPQVFEEVTRHSAAGVAWFAHQPYRIVRPDGAAVWVGDYTVVLRDPDGQISHYYGYIMDISDQVEQLRRLHAQERVIERLASPILRVARGVLAMPVLGELGEDRRARMTDDLLGAIAGGAAHTAILDLTGLRELDGATVDHLTRIARAVGLLGCRCVVSGFSAEAAARAVQRGVDTRALTTVATLQDALELALARR